MNEREEKISKFIDVHVRLSMIEQNLAHFDMSGGVPVVSRETAALLEKWKEDHVYFIGVLADTEAVTPVDLFLKMQWLRKTVKGNHDKNIVADLLDSISRDYEIVHQI